MHHVIEMRSYTLKPDMATRFDQLMQQQSLPLLRAAGTDVVRAQPSLHTALDYVLIRAYASLAERSASQLAFYASAAWLDGPCEALMACIDSYHTVVLAVTAQGVDALRAHPPGSAGAPIGTPVSSD